MTDGVLVIDTLSLRGADNLCRVCGRCVCEEYSLKRHAMMHLREHTAILTEDDRVVPR